MNYREEPFEGDELDRMRARQQRKKQGAPSRRSSRRDTPDSVPECRSYSRTPDAPDADFDDLSPNQIEELDLDDYDTYENALEQELNRTIAQSEKEQEYSRGRNRQSDMRQNRADYAYERPRRKRRKKKHFGKILILVVCLFAGLFLYRHFRDNGYWTIAVFGVDSRDGNLEKGALSDVEMIASINKKTGEIRLVSVFRDSYLRISDQEDDYDKINEAYFKGGHEQAVQALERNLNLKIDDYTTFNWKAVVDAINVLGGVDIEISDKEFAYINSFITETVNSTGVGSYQLDHSGMNHLDGVQAVAYARLRLMDTDFQRTERQRKVISLALEKAKQADLATRTNLVKAILPQISTSVGIDDVLPLAKNVSKYHIGETAGFPFTQKTKKMGKMDCVIPVTLESNVVTLHQFLYGEDALYSPSSTVKKISDHIAEESGFYKGGKAAPTSSGSGKSDSKGQSSGNSKKDSPSPAQTAAQTAAAESSEAEETIDETSAETDETAAEESNSAIIEKLDDPKVEKETTSASEGGPGTVKPKETEKATETTADDSSKGPGMQETVSNSGNTSGENTEKADLIGPGV